MVHSPSARSALAGRQLACEASGQLSRQDRCRGRPRQAGSLGHRPSRAPATGGVRRLPARQARHATGEVLTDVVQIYGCIWCPKPFPPVPTGVHARESGQKRVPLRPRASSPLVPVWSNHVPHPDRSSPGARPVASEHPRWLVAVARRCSWLCAHTPREAATVGRARSARPGGWRRHSKRHASRRNLKAPFAFKVSMVH